MFWALKQKVGNQTQKLILITLADIANEKRECWPSHQYISDRAECSRSSVIRHLAELEKKGLIITVRRVDEGGMKSSNIYQIPDVSDCNIDVSERHKGSVRVTQGGSVTVTHNTPTIFKPLNDTPTGFDLFWDAYPKKVAKKAARRAWDKNNHPPADQLITDIHARIERGAWCVGKGKAYIPNPATYLNGEGWEDEIIPRSDFNPEPDYSAIAREASELAI